MLRQRLTMEQVPTSFSSPEQIKARFGQAVRVARQNRGLSQTAISRWVALRPVDIDEIEDGAGRRLLLEKAVRWVQALDISLDEACGVFYPHHLAPWWTDPDRGHALVAFLARSSDVEWAKVLGFIAGLQK